MARKATPASFVKDDPRINRTGLNRGHNKFETDFNAAVETIAKQNKIPFSEARQRLLLVAYRAADKGEFNFFKYIHDQIYGTAPQEIKVDTTVHEEASPAVLKLANEILALQRGAPSGE